MEDWFMTTMLRGAEVASALGEQILSRGAALRAAGVLPRLAVVRVGERPDDLSYERGILKKAAALGVAVQREALPPEAGQTALCAVLRRLAGDPAAHGVLLFRPLPAGYDEAEALSLLPPEKDVDGVTAQSLAGVFAGSGAGFAPCTAQACMEILRHYAIPLSGRRAVVVGRSLVVGKPVAMLLLSQNATVTLCHSRSENLPALCREADILIAAAGKRGLIGREFLSPKQVVLDVGIHVNDEGRLCGDVLPEAEGVVAALTPVPGGVGAVTTTVLLSHVVEAAGRGGGGGAAS